MRKNMQSLRPAVSRVLVFHSLLIASIFGTMCKCSKIKVPLSMVPLIMVPLIEVPLIKILT